MFLKKGSVSIASVVVLGGLSEVVVACSEDFTCDQSRSCPSANPDSGSRGGSAGVAGAGATGGTGVMGSSGSMGSAGALGSSGAMGSAGSGDSSAGTAGEAGNAGTAGDAGPDGDAGSDAPSCASEMPNTALGVFVSSAGQDGADGAMCGTRESPCKTIGKALGIATAGRIVYLDAGTYEEDGLALRSGVTLQGGWARSGVGVWSRVCNADRNSQVIIRPRTADRTLSAVDLAGTATLETLTIRSKTAAAAAGQSLYGIFATGASTEIVTREVAIEVGAAGGGSAGAVGQDGAGPAGICSAGTGADGATAGGVGSGAPSGNFGATGYVPAPGVVGGIGSDGNHGTAAPAAPCVACPDTGAVCQQQCVGMPICMIRCGWSATVPSCGVAGINGCGGGGGKGGAPGNGGGSSVGVFLWNAKLRANSGTITSGRGGDGGPGGAAGRGKVGSAGAPGLTGAACVGCLSNFPAAGCSQQGSQVPAAGVSGGIGGAGKDGGPGGGGSGGHSYAVYKGGTAMADVAAAVMLVAGSPGVGGAATSRGTDGSAKPIGP